MKKLTFLFVFGALAISGLSGCKKFLGKVFGGQTIVLDPYYVTVPAIPFADSTLAFSAGTITTYINTDSIIRAQTGGSDNINDAATIKVSSVTLTATNADASNNLSAFKSFRVSIASNANSTPSSMFSLDIPAYAGSTYTGTPYANNNIVGYLHGDTIKNVVSGNVRKKTSKSLYVEAVITMYAN